MSTTAENQTAEASNNEEQAVVAPGPYAIVRIGNHDHTVKVGDKISIEWDREVVTEDEELTFDSVLLVKKGDSDVSVGTPLVKGASVTAKVMQRQMNGKLVCFKRTRRQGFKKKKGHRQNMLQVEIAAIQ